MRATSLAPWAAVLLLAAPQPAPARPDIVEDLVHNAWYWQVRAREDKAAEAWGKVLAVQPNDQDALEALGAFEARRGHAARAREYRDRLVAAGATPRKLATVDRAIEIGPRHAR